MNAIQTTEVLTRFYADCVRFWEREGKQKQEAAKLALTDIECLNANPYEPAGHPLDSEAQRVVIETIKTVLM